MININEGQSEEHEVPRDVVVYDDVSMIKNTKNKGVIVKNNQKNRKDFVSSIRKFDDRSKLF